MVDKLCNVNPIFIEQFIDGELPYDESAEMAHHLKECDSCRAFYQSTLSLKREGVAEAELSFMERKGFEQLIDENGTSSVGAILKRCVAFFKRPSFIYISATAALSVIVFLFLFSLTSIEDENLLMTQEILNIHNTKLPCDMCEKENIEKLVKAKLNIDSGIENFIRGQQRAKGRFSHIGTVPVASIKIEDKNERGTLVLSRNNRLLKKMFTSKPCVKETGCKARLSKEGDHEMLFWERGDGNYLFVTDSPRLKSNMVKLIDAH